MTKTTLIRTQNNLADADKQKVIRILNQQLADLIDLGLITKQAHWNLRGLQFIAIHEMLDEFRDTVLEQQDTLAERVAQLGGTAAGTLQQVHHASRLSSYPGDIHAITDHLQALIQRYAMVANQLRQDIDAVAADPISSGLLTNATEALDKCLWLLEAHFA